VKGSCRFKSKGVCLDRVRKIEGEVVGGMGGFLLLGTKERGGEKLNTGKRGIAVRFKRAEKGVGERLVAREKGNGGGRWSQRGEGGAKPRESFNKQGYSG